MKTMAVHGSLWMACISALAQGSTFLPDFGRLHRLSWVLWVQVAKPVEGSQFSAGTWGESLLE